MAKYIAENYVVPDYVDNETTPSYPTDTRVSIYRKFELAVESVWVDGLTVSWLNETSNEWTAGYILGGDTLDITDYITKASIHREAGLPYATLSLTLLNLKISNSAVKNPLARLTVVLGSDTYSFIIIDMDVDNTTETTLLCKTDGCLLDFPFSLKTTANMIGDSKKVLNTLLAPVDNTILVSNFNFNRGSFILDGTNIEGVQKILDITGGILLYKNNKLVVSKALRVSDESDITTIIDASITTDTEITDDIDGSPLLHRVIINDEDIYSEPKITMITDEVLEAKPYFLFNPIPSSVSQIKSNLGELLLSNKMLEFTGDVDSNNISVDGGILSIARVRINSEDITNYVYEYGHNVIKFDTIHVGTINVIYTTKSLFMYSIDGSIDGNLRTYNLTYLNQKLSTSVEIPKKESGKQSASRSVPTKSGSGIKLPSTVMRDEPIEIYIPKDSITNFSFVTDSSAPLRSSVSIPFSIKSYGLMDDTFIKNISINSTEIEETGTAQIEDTEFGLGIVLPVGNYYNFMVGIRSIDFHKRSMQGYDIYYTKDVTSKGASVSFNYKADMDKITVPPIGLYSSIKYLEVHADGQIAVVTYPDPDNEYIEDKAVSYRLPQDVVIDVALRLKIDAFKIAGKIVTSQTLGDHTINSQGKISVKVLTALRHKIDCSSIIRGATIYVDSRNAIEEGS